MTQSVQVWGSLAILGIDLEGSGLPLVTLLLLLSAAGIIGFIAGRRPVLFLRPFLWLVGHTVYRLRVYGKEHVPAEGGALLVCNHVSYIDWLLLLAAQRRYIRFVIFAGWTQKWGLRHLLRWAGVIPIDGSAGPRAIIKSLRAAGDAIKRGELVCIFAEGRFTRTGFLLPFHRGFQQIVKYCPAPIIPVCLDHLWGSVFSYRGGKVLWKWPQQIPYPVTVAFGAPMESSSSAAEVRLVIQKLSADSAIASSQDALLVHRQFIRQAARRPFRTCLTDSITKKMLSYAEALAGANIIAHRLKPLLGDDRMVGLWMPPSIGGALANIALTILGKTSVNLNYTAGPDTIRSAVEQCGMRKVLTARRFTSRVAIDPGPDVELIYLDDIKETITTWERIRSYLAVLLLPRFVVERWVLPLAPTHADDIATIIFSSGSTGEPKGIMLSHGNVVANAKSMVQAIDATAHDRILGVLPFFHSFGFTVTLWVPLQIGASLVYHADPRQAKEIGQLARKYRCTIFLTTPTFLRFCLRRCQDNDFQSLRLLICGAEKMPQSLATDFEKKFQVLPLEGYGCTELSPAASANVPDREMDGFKQIGNKPGSIGQPLPGIAARIVDSNTYEPVPIGQEGLLLIYGPNVMKGYLNRPELTERAIRDGWYVTGDMAKLDEDGFLTITGRLARFAKIGGEMVPLERIEEELNDVLETSERICAVTTVSDEKRGERLMVLHVPINGTDVPQVVAKLHHRGLPNLWIPGERDFHEVEELPILGSGKLDLKRLQTMAQSVAG